MSPAAPDPERRSSGVADGSAPDGLGWKPWWSFVALVTALGGALAGGLLIGGIGAATGASIRHPPPAVNIIATVFQDACLILAAILFAQMARRPAPWQFGLRPTRVGPAVGWVVLAYVAFIALSAAWVSLLGLKPEDLPKELGVDKSHYALAASAVLVCVIAPIAEEFFFRGFFFSALRAWRGLWPAAIITGLVFGAIHAGGSVKPGYLVPLAIFGFVLCLVYERTRSLYPCIALHCLNNSIAFGSGVGWDWQVPLLFAGAGALIALAALGVRRAFDAPPASSVSV